MCYAYSGLTGDQGQSPAGVMPAAAHLPDDPRAAWAADTTATRSHASKQHPRERNSHWDSLSPSRRVRFTNRFAEPFPEPRVSALQQARTRTLHACRLIPVTGTIVLRPIPLIVFRQAGLPALCAIDEAGGGSI
jgi:hypothetical protein